MSGSTPSTLVYAWWPTTCCCLHMNEDAPATSSVSCMACRKNLLFPYAPWFASCWMETPISALHTPWKNANAALTRNELV